MAKTAFEALGPGKSKGTRAINPKDTKTELARLRRPAKTGPERPIGRKKGGMIKKKSK